METKDVCLGRATQRGETATWVAPRGPEEVGRGCPLCVVSLHLDTGVTPAPIPSSLLSAPPICHRPPPSSFRCYRSLPHHPSFPFTMAFSYQEHHPFLLDSPYFPRSPAEMLLVPQQGGEMANNASSSSCFPYPYPYPSEASPVAPATDAGAYGTSAPSVDSHTVCSPVASETHDAENKRKSRDEASLMITSELKNTKEGEIKKQRRPRGGQKKTEEIATKPNDSKGSKACLDTTGGYVHVRARRGQATDSHSLAERARREKISERMKMLQGLVPGCEKVTGKALMLDEIINYVQSLQNQVEFLSMKIASLSPILYGFDVDFGDCMDQPQFQKLMRSIPEAMASAEQTNQLQAKAFGNGATGYRVMDNSTPLLLQVKGPASFSQQDGGSALQVGEQRQGSLDQVGFINMCSFQ